MTIVTSFAAAIADRTPASFVGAPSRTAAALPELSVM